MTVLGRNVLVLETNGGGGSTQAWHYVDVAGTGCSVDDVGCVADVLAGQEWASNPRWVSDDVDLDGAWRLDLTCPLR